LLSACESLSPFQASAHPPDRPGANNISKLQLPDVFGLMKKPFSPPPEPPVEFTCAEIQKSPELAASG